MSESKRLRIIRNYKTLNIRKFENKHKSRKTKISNKWKNFREGFEKYKIKNSLVGED